MVNKLLSNTNKIIELEEENKQLLEDIENYDIYEDNKLEEFNNTLKEVLNIQKQFNNLVCDIKSPITEKYLPLPYDINEIIRNNIKKDSKLKFKHNHIDKCFKLIESKFQSQLLSKISHMTYRYYNNPHNIRLNWLRRLHLTDWNKLFENLNGDKWFYWIGEVSTVHIDCCELETLYNECKDYIHKKFKNLYEDYESLNDSIRNLFNLCEEQEYGDDKWYVKYLFDYYSGEYIRIRNCNGRKNGIAYKKLLKCINNILYTHLSDKNEDDYIIKSDTYKEWSNNTYWRFTNSFYDIDNSNYELVKDSCNNPRYN